MSRKHNPPLWVPISIALGLTCIVAGFGLLTWTPRSTSLAQREAAQARLSAMEQTGAAALPTLVMMVTSAPAEAPTLTVSASPTATQAVSLSETGATFTLTIVHSNDTWGYTRPCG